MFASYWICFSVLIIAVFADTNTTDVHTNKPLPEGFIPIGLNINQTVSKTSNSTTASKPVEAFLNKELANTVVNESSINFAQVSGKLLVSANNSLLNTGVSRSIIGSEASSSESNPNVSSTGGSSASLTLILVSLVAFTCIIAIILAALFVMRRRFSIWRINGSRSNENGCNDGANGVLTNTSGSENASIGGDKVTQENEKDPNLLKKSSQIIEVVENANNHDALTSVENKQACLQAESGHSNDAADIKSKDDVPTELAVNDLDINKKEVEINDNKDEDLNKQQASPSSASPLINDEQAPASEDKTQDSEQQQQQQAATTTSSSSLIVNVLNELSESVASKLASKSPIVTSTDSEKQPLNNE